MFGILIEYIKGEQRERNVLNVFYSPMYWKQTTFFHPPGCFVSQWLRAEDHAAKAGEERQDGKLKLICFLYFSPHFLLPCHVTRAFVGTRLDQNVNEL